ncbi:regulator of G- signaling 3-like isoform X2 [Labeo rohita]|uniref:Regulator of G-signaling 3-like isoform X2 n=1 Tax=Labeo rohita TaxID=84645 RepID=A0A498NF82_LABRO|nr:regulator of G- signaling 3-like isoform X2 [Labeo rohita]
MYSTPQASVPQPPAASAQTAPGLASRTCFMRCSGKSKTQHSGNYQQNSNFANYQNCTIVRSHVPHTNYGTYVKVTPKILIFPIFVQVTIFIYTDLMLVTREDELGRCNVLQNPLYLRQLQLQYVSTFNVQFRHFIRHFLSSTRPPNKDRQGKVTQISAFTMNRDRTI